MTKYVLLVLASWVSVTFAMEQKFDEKIVRCKSPYTVTLSERQRDFLTHYKGFFNEDQKGLVCLLLKRFVFTNDKWTVPQRLLLLKSYFAPQLIPSDTCRWEQRGSLYNIASALPNYERFFVMGRMPSINLEWDGT